jgi:hypothetical protein
MESGEKRAAAEEEVIPKRSMALGDLPSSQRTQRQVLNVVVCFEEHSPTKKWRTEHNNWHQHQYGQTSIGGNVSALQPQPADE